MSDNPNVSQSDLQQAFESYHQIILPYLGGSGSSAIELTPNVTWGDKFNPSYSFCKIYQIAPHLGVLLIDAAPRGGIHSLDKDDYIVTLTNLPINIGNQTWVTMSNYQRDNYTQKGVEVYCVRPYGASYGGQLEVRVLAAKDIKEYTSFAFTTNLFLAPI